MEKEVVLYRNDSGSPVIVEGMKLDSFGNIVLIIRAVTPIPKPFLDAFDEP